MVARSDGGFARLRRPGQLVLAATGLGLVTASWIYVIGILEGQETPFVRVLFFVAPFWYLWAAYAPAVVWMARHRPIERGHLLARFSVHLTLAVSMSLAHTSIRFTLQPAIREQMHAGAEGMSNLDLLSALATLELPVHLFVYAAIVGVTYTVGYYRRLRERELATTRLSEQLAHARMQALRMQLNPHFLFNALNSVAMMVRDSNRNEAVDTLERLSDLLRYVLDDYADQEVRLERELEFIQRYLAIEATRFRDRLRVRIEAGDDTLDALVPNLILQPIVENAIRHGIAGRAAASAVKVASRRDGGVLQLRVEDDGPGLREESSDRSGAGVGINNTRKRLAQLYGDAASVTLESLEPNGALATVTLPFHTAAVDRQEPT